MTTLERYNSITKLRLSRRRQWMNKHHTSPLFDNALIEIAQRVINNMNNKLDIDYFENNPYYEGLTKDEIRSIQQIITQLY